MPPEEKQNGEPELRKAANMKRRGTYPGGPKDLEAGPATEVIAKLDALLDTLIERRLRVWDRTVSERMEGEMWMDKRKNRKRVLFTLRPV